MGDNENFNRIISGLEEAARHAGGEDVPGMRVYPAGPPMDVRGEIIRQFIEANGHANGEWQLNRETMSWWLTPNPKVAVRKTN